MIHINSEYKENTVVSDSRFIDILSIVFSLEMLLSLRVEVITTILSVYIFGLPTADKIVLAQ